MILDFDPIPRRLLGCSIVRVLPLRNDALQIKFTHFLKELLTSGFDVIDVQDTGPLPSKELLQPSFSLDQRQMAQIFAVEKHQIKGEEQGFASSEQKIVEQRAPGLV